jgi:hypothetical protein
MVGLRSASYLSKGAPIDGLVGIWWVSKKPFSATIFDSPIVSTHGGNGEVLKQPPITGNIGGLVAMLVRMFDRLVRYDVPDRRAAMFGKQNQGGWRSVAARCVCPSQIPLVT